MKMIPTANPHAPQRAADAFTAAHPIGTRVLVTFEGGAERVGKIKTRASVVNGIASVRVAFVGISGVFYLPRVRKA